MKKLFILGFIVASSFSYAACPDGKTYQVTLTFDDGPHRAFTPQVLDVLEQEKVKGTFFVLGKHFAGGKGNANNKWKYDILDRMKKSGHTIGSHTYEHLNHPSQSQQTIIDNIYKPNELLKDYLSPVLRLPYGGGAFRSKNPDTQRKNDFIMNTIKKSGFKHVLWDIDTNDWDPKKRPTLLPTMLKDICSHKGGVILFHDIQKNTADNLQSWIRAIKAEGHQIVGLERFVPEAAHPLPPEACEIPGNSEVDRLEKFIREVDRSL